MKFPAEFLKRLEEGAEFGEVFGRFVPREDIKKLEFPGLSDKELFRGSFDNGIGKPLPVIGSQPRADAFYAEGEARFPRGDLRREQSRRSHEEIKALTHEIHLEETSDLGRLKAQRRPYAC